MADPTETYVLSANDLVQIKRMLSTQRTDRKNTSSRGESLSPIDDEEQPTPEIYVARTPHAGLPALDSGTFTGSGTGSDAQDDKPGQADCYIWQILISDTGDPLLYPTERLFKTVYNLAKTAIAGDTWILVARDKFGKWIAVNGGGDSTFLALLIGKTYTDGEFIAYHWVRVIDSSHPVPITYTENTTESPYHGEYGNKPAYHQRNLDIPVVPVFEDSAAFTGFETGTGTGVPLYVSQLSVVRMWRGKSKPGTGTGTPGQANEYYLFDVEPWVDVFRRTGVIDDYGEIGYNRVYGQGNGSWMDGTEVRIIEAE